MSNDNVSKLIFKIDFVNPNTAEEINLLTRDMLYPYSKEINEGGGEDGLPLKNDNILQNSVEAVQTAQKINYLVRTVLKDSTMDYMEKYRYSDMALKPFDTEQCYYRMTLEDVNYPIYLSNGNRLMQITVTDDKGKTIITGTNNSASSDFINTSKYSSDKYKIDVQYMERPIILFSSTIDARDYVYNSNFVPPFNKIWKDFSHINDPNPNSEYKENGVTKKTMNLGIRSLIKNLLTYNDFTNRFTDPVHITNSHCGYSFTI